jgi:AcrR family transcriptional regulator
MPRRADAARRAALARAAFEVLRARGTQTSMRELADALGVKRPTLYFYFPDLAAVLAALLEPLIQALAEAVIARMREQSHPIDRLRAAIDAALAFHRERPQLVGALLQLWSLGGGELASRFERERRGLLAVRDAVVGDLRGGIARREVRPCDPERVVDLVLSFLEGAVVHHALGLARGDDSRDELVRRVLDPLRPLRPLRALRKRRPRSRI